MEVAKFCATYPRLYHMAHANAWEGIKKHGLLSTAALLDLFDVPSNRRRAINSVRRPQSVDITHALHGRAVIRDQKPMSDERLARCLTNPLTPDRWYELLNSKVFFWVSEDRLEKLLGARAYCREPQLVITLDTASLVKAYGAQISLCPINSGATLYTPPLRGLETFQRIEAFDFEYWRERGRTPQNVVVECAVEHSVRNIERFLIGSEVRSPKKPK